jgi:hypothetical protein
MSFSRQEATAMAMRIIEKRLAAAIPLLFATSCGGASDKEILTAACDVGVHTKQVCECYAEAVKEKLSAGDYEFFIKKTTEQMKLAKSTAGMSVEEAMEASKGAAQDALSDPVRMSRIGAAASEAMFKCVE